METSNETENCENLTPPSIVQAAKSTTENLLPAKSKDKYDTVYRLFMDWRNVNKTNSFSENVLLAYFGELSKKYKSSSLWTFYSMLRSTLTLNHNINIETYPKLRSLLKRQSDGYVPKKSKVFTPEEINSFISKAPDEIYLVTKVVLIMGLMGACRSQELYLMQIEHIQDFESDLLVSVPITKTKTERKFIITGNYYHICKKYINLRPVGISSFFMNYQKGKCTKQVIGINKLRNMGKQVATYLKLENPSSYTGHSFRRSSATILVDAGGDLTALKRHGAWKSTAVAEGYVDNSNKNRMDTANKIIGMVQPNLPPKMTFEETKNSVTTNENNCNSVNLPSMSGAAQFYNCPNITVNIYTTYSNDVNVQTNNK